MIIAITGSVGTGKTEVAKLLAKKLGYKLIELNKLAEKTNAYCGYDRKRKCKIVDIEILKKEVKKLKGDYIIESHYAHDMPCDLVIILRTQPKELIKRLKKRNYSKAKIEENLEAEIMEIIKQETIEQSKKFIEIDTANKTAKTAVEAVIKALKVT